MAEIKECRIALLGFGNVARAFVTLLERKSAVLARDYNLRCQITGAFSPSRGTLINPAGLSLATLATCTNRTQWPQGLGEISPPDPADLQPGVSFIQACPADLVIELSPLDPHHGEPAITHIRQALLTGRHTITANKGPLAFAYRELVALAKSQQRAFRFESTVMDGAPVFALAEFCLKATSITAIRGLLNSTTNAVLGNIAAGGTLAEGIAQAQALGIAEADPTLDLAGWDCAVKLAALSNVLLKADLHPNDVLREEIDEMAIVRCRQAATQNRVLKQVGLVVREENPVTGRQKIRAAVQLEELNLDDPFATINGTSSILELHTDTLGPFSILLQNGETPQTAFGLLNDLLLIYA